MELETNFGSQNYTTVMKSTSQFQFPLFFSRTLRFTFSRKKDCRNIEAKKAMAMTVFETLQECGDWSSLPPFIEAFSAVPSYGTSSFLVLANIIPFTI